MFKKKRLPSFLSFLFLGLSKITRSLSAQKKTNKNDQANPRTSNQSPILKDYFNRIAEFIRSRDDDFPVIIKVGVKFAEERPANESWIEFDPTAVGFDKSTKISDSTAETASQLAAGQLILPVTVAVNTDKIVKNRKHIDSTKDPVAIGTRPDENRPAEKRKFYASTPWRNTGCASTLKSAHYPDWAEHDYLDNPHLKSIKKPEAKQIHVEGVPWIDDPGISQLVEYTQKSLISGNDTDASQGWLPRALLQRLRLNLFGQSDEKVRTDVFQERIKALEEEAVEELKNRKMERRSDDTTQKIREAELMRKFDIFTESLEFYQDNMFEIGVSVPMLFDKRRFSNNVSNRLAAFSQITDDSRLRLWLNLDMQPTKIQDSDNFYEETKDMTWGLYRVESTPSRKKETGKVTRRQPEFSYVPSPEQFRRVLRDYFEKNEVLEISNMTKNMLPPTHFDALPYANRTAWEQRIAASCAWQNEYPIKGSDSLVNKGKSVMKKVDFNHAKEFSSMLNKPADWPWFSRVSYDCFHNVGRYETEFPALSLEAVVGAVLGELDKTGNISTISNKDASVEKNKRTKNISLVELDTQGTDVALVHSLAAAGMLTRVEKIIFECQDPSPAGFMYKHWRGYLPKRNSIGKDGTENGAHSTQTNGAKTDSREMEFKEIPNECGAAMELLESEGFRVVKKKLNGNCMMSEYNVMAVNSALDVT